MTSPRRVGVFVVAGLVVANLLVLILASDSLYRSRQFYELRAETQTKNIGSAVDQNISPYRSRCLLASSVTRIIRGVLQPNMASFGLTGWRVKLVVFRSEAVKK